MMEIRMSITYPIFKKILTGFSCFFTHIGYLRIAQITRPHLDLTYRIV